MASYRRSDRDQQVIEASPTNITSAYKSFSQMHEAGILQENLELEESSIENIHPELHRISICCFTMLGSSLSCLALQSVLQQR